MLKRKRIAIFGAASNRVTPKIDLLKEGVYSECFKLGLYLAQKKHFLIYGAGSTGVMGAVYEGYIAGDPEVRPFGSTTKYIAQIESPREDINLILTDTMSQRKELYWLADMCIICPGGLGTLDELFEFMTMKKLGQWDGEIIILKDKTSGMAKEIERLLLHCEKMGAIKNVKSLYKVKTLEQLKEYL